MSVSGGCGAGDSGGVMQVLLREVLPVDLEIFFLQQLDTEAQHMAAFVRPETAQRSTFLTRWALLLQDKSIMMRTILADEHIAGHVLSHRAFGEPEISYWIDRKLWGRGIATRAVAAFLLVEAARPLFARVAHDNAASRRVLEKNGFVLWGEDEAFAHARNENIRELILKLA